MDISITPILQEKTQPRAARHNYPTKKALGGGRYLVGIGENIGLMPIGNVVGIGVVTDQDDSVAHTLVDSWTNSPGHRANILNAEYSRLGVGIAYNREYYAIQDFW